MTKEQFFKLNREIFQLPPDISIQTEYMMKYFNDLGFSTESGYKSVQYYYAELLKAKEEKESVFGSVIKLEDSIGIVRDGASIFKISNEKFDKIKEIYFPTKATQKPYPNEHEEIDFNQTSPEYFIINKANELDNQYKVKIICDKYFLDRNDGFEKDYKIGDIITEDPVWPDNPKEAFELFKNYYATKSYFTSIGIFLDDISEQWDDDLISEELAKINSFIDEAMRIDKKDALKKGKRHTGQEAFKVVYIRLAKGYYLKNHIESDVYQAKYVYGKYFLFKELLEKKIKSNQNELSNNTLQTKKGILEEDENLEYETESFISFLDHPKKETLAKELRKEFSGEYGRTIAMLIAAMDEKNILKISKGKFKQLITSMSEYWNKRIGRYNGIMSYINTNKLGILSQTFNKKSDIVDFSRIQTRLQKILKELKTNN